MKGWIIIDSKGNPIPDTLSWWKKDSIATFKKGICFTWDELKQNGWKCVKCELKLNENY